MLWCEQSVSSNLTVTWQSDHTSDRSSALCYHSEIRLEQHRTKLSYYCDLDWFDCCDTFGIIKTAKKLFFSFCLEQLKFTCIMQLGHFFVWHIINMLADAVYSNHACYGVTATLLLNCTGNWRTGTSVQSKTTQNKVCKNIILEKIIK